MGRLTFAIWLMLMATVVTPVMASSWPLDDVEVAEPGGRESRFVYVPQGERFESVMLEADLMGGMELQRLEVRLDDALLHSARWRDSQRLEVELPTLAPGFHRLDFVGWRAPIGLAEADTDAESEVQCPLLQMPPVQLQNLALEYSRAHTGGVALNQLPDGLYNPSHPGEAVGWLDVDHPDAYAAAARLISGELFPGRVRWLTSGSGDEEDADFRVRLQRDERLETAAIITLQPANAPGGGGGWRNSALAQPTLDIRYPSAAGLEAAVHRLLDEDQRVQLTAPSAEVAPSVKAPSWARLRTSASLADLGFEDLRLNGSRDQSLSLAFPPHWQPTGPLSGQLRLRGQASLPEGSRLDVWLDGVLGASQPLGDLPSNDIQRSPLLDGGRRPLTAMLSMRLSPQMEVPRRCAWPLWGSLWVDAEESRLELPHLPKSGVMALIPRLLADPEVMLDADHPDAAMQLLSGVMRLQSAAATPHAVPYRVRTGTLTDLGADSAPSLSIMLDLEQVDRLQQRYADRVSPVFAAESLRWQADQEGRSVITAPTPEILRQAASRLNTVGYQIPDGARDVLIHASEGTLVVLAEQPVVITQPARPVSRQQMEWGLWGVAVLFTLLVVWLIWRRRRGARSELS